MNVTGKWLNVNYKKNQSVYKYKIEMILKLNNTNNFQTGLAFKTWKM